MSEEKRIIEINGIKMEVDLRTAKRIDVFRVGDPVKVLDKSYTDYKIRAGVIVDFVEFKDLPAIEVMMMMEGYQEVNFEFITITSKSEKFEITHYNPYEQLFTKANVIDVFERKIDKKRLEIEELKRQKKYFINDFQKAFEKIPEKQSPID